MKDDKIISIGVKKFSLLKKKAYLKELDKREERLSNARSHMPKPFGDSEE